MAFKRIAATALSQLGLLACGAGLVLALQAGLFAGAAVLALTSLWIATAVAWRSRLRPTLLVETPRQIAREAVQAQLMASLLDQTPAPLLTLDEKGGLRARNRVARHLFRTDDLILTPPPDLLATMDASASSGRKATRIGDRAFVISRSEVWTSDGPLRLAVLLDIEADLRAAEATALRDLMQVLSHEIMNGLTPVASLAATVQDLLADGGVEARRQACEAVAVLSRRAEGLVRFAEGYRALARLPPPDLSKTSVAALIQEAAQLFRSRWAAGDVLLVVLPLSADLEITADRDQLMHAVLNLLANAAEAALAGEAPPRVDLVCKAVHRGVVISVGDSGEGIAGPLRSRVFQPFFTTKAQGTGVGLSLSRQIARAHGGDLDLRSSEPGKGAVFDLRLEA